MPPTTPLHTENGTTDIQRWAQAGEDVRAALQALHDELGGLLYALMIDGHTSRRMWPGLHNNKQGLRENLDDHAALQMDLGHPQYRLSAPKDPESAESWTGGQRHPIRRSPVHPYAESPVECGDRRS